VAADEPEADTSAASHKSEAPMHTEEAVHSNSSSSSKNVQHLLFAALLPAGALAVAAVCSALGHNCRYKRGGRVASMAADAALPAKGDRSGSNSSADGNAAA
jgi:hypothetical protein